MYPFPFLYIPLSPHYLSLPLSGPGSYINVDIIVTNRFWWQFLLPRCLLLRRAHAIGHSQIRWIDRGIYGFRVVCVTERTTKATRRDISIRCFVTHLPVKSISFRLSFFFCYVIIEKFKFNVSCKNLPIEIELLIESHLLLHLVFYFFVIIISLASFE